jgi:hypothetical protein
MSGLVTIRRAALLTLAVVVAAGFYRSRLADATASAAGTGPAAAAAATASAPRGFDQAAARLDARVASYLALRRADDWVGLYELTDPAHRARVDRTRFLLMYGQGVLRVVDIEATAATIDSGTRTARVSLSTTAELVAERLPAQFRRGFHEDHPEHLRQEIAHELAWVWRDGEWWFEMDPELLTGHDAAGSAIELLGDAR